MINNNSMLDYASLAQPYQRVLPLNVEVQIPKDDPVCLVRYCIGGMDLSVLMLLAMAHNVQKLHHKIQHKTAGRHRILVKAVA